MQGPPALIGRAGVDLGFGSGAPQIQFLLWISSCTQSKALLNWLRPEIQLIQQLHYFSKWACAYMAKFEMLHTETEKS